MIMNQQIEKVFGNQLYDEKKQTFNQEYLKKSFMNNYINQEKKISSKRNINYQDDRSPISNKLKINDSFYFEFKKKFKENNENDKNLSNINIKTTKNKKHLFTKPGFKKEISQGNLLSRNFFDGKKELEINKNSKIKNSQSPKNRTKINNKRYNIFFDDKKNSKIIEIKQMETQNNSIINNLNLNNKNKTQFLLKNNYIGLNSENEKIEKIVQFQIINKYKKFDILQVENVIYGQILKNADFSNVKKLDLNYKKDNFNNFNSNINSNSDIKITDNVINHPEINYQVPNNVLTQKKNNIFCCF
jgi:hypothetical protein